MEIEAEHKLLVAVDVANKVARREVRKLEAIVRGMDEKARTEAETAFRMGYASSNTYSRQLAAGGHATMQLGPVAETALRAFARLHKIAAEAPGGKSQVAAFEPHLMRFAVAFKAYVDATAPAPVAPPTPAAPTKVAPTIRLSKTGIDIAH